MSSDKILIADPNNKEHIVLFDYFKKENDLTENLLDYLKNNNQQELKNIIIKQILFLKDKDGIKDSCFISAEKDKKMATLEFPKLKKQFKNREMITYSENYSFNTLGMEEVFIQTSPTNKELINNLETKEYENLGETDGIITFMKEKENTKDQGMITHGTR